MLTVALVIAALVLRGLRRPRSAQSSPPSTALRLDALAAELRRGASLRSALAQTVNEPRVTRLALSGQPMPVVAAAAAAGLHRPELIQAAIQLAGSSGAPSSELFARIADRVRADEELERERRTLTAQARLSAAVVAGMPLVIGAALMLGGRGSLLTSGGPARTVTVIGAALQLAGLATVVLLLRWQR